MVDIYVFDCGFRETNDIFKIFIIKTIRLMHVSVLLYR